jgi:hypothetical protein
LSLLTFIRQFSKTAKHLRNKKLLKNFLALKSFQDFGLNVNLCVGIGTDRCSVMTSEKVKAVKETQKKASNAFRCPCFNHVLNITISVSSSVVSIQNSIGAIKETIALLTSSAKQRVVVDSICVRKIKKTLRNKIGRAGRSSCRFF